MTARSSCPRPLNERLPVEEHGDTILYAAGEGTLSRRDPRQMEMPGLKEVRAPSGPAKEIG